MVSCSSSPPLCGGKRRPQPDNHRTQALQRPNECRTLPGRRGACFPRAVAGGFERRLETVFAASYTKAVLTYGLTGSLARCWWRFDGGRVRAPLYVPLPGFRWLRSGLAVTNGIQTVTTPRIAASGAHWLLQAVTFCCIRYANCYPARVSLGATSRSAIALAWMSIPSAPRRSGA